MNKDIGVEVTDPKPLQNCTVQSYNYICGDMSGIIDFSNPIPLMDFNNCTCNVTLTPIIAVQSAPLITSSFNVDICREGKLKELYVYQLYHLLCARNVDMYLHHKSSHYICGFGLIFNYM